MQKRLREQFRLQFWCQDVEACSVLALTPIHTARCSKSTTAMQAEYDDRQYCWSPVFSRQQIQLNITPSA